MVFDLRWNLSNPYGITTYGELTVSNKNPTWRYIIHRTLPSRSSRYLLSLCTVFRRLDTLPIRIWSVRQLQPILSNSAPYVTSDHLTLYFADTGPRLCRAIMVWKIFGSQVGLTPTNLFRT